MNKGTFWHICMIKSIFCIMQDIAWYCLAFLVLLVWSSVTIRALVGVNKRNLTWRIFFGICPKKLLVLVFIFTICHWLWQKTENNESLDTIIILQHLPKSVCFLLVFFLLSIFSINKRYIKVHFVWFVPNRFPSYLFLQQSIHGVWKRIFCLSTTLVHFSCLQMPTNHICHFFST